MLQYKKKKKKKPSTFILIAHEYIFYNIPLLI